MSEQDDEPPVLAEAEPTQLDRIEALLRQILEAVTAQSGSGGLGHGGGLGH